MGFSIGIVYQPAIFYLQAQRHLVWKLNCQAVAVYRDLLDIVLPNPCDDPTWYVNN
jgi:hypothetical protein